MGYGSYTASDWNKLKQSRGISSRPAGQKGTTVNTSSANVSYYSQQIQDKYNARFVEMRESFDSEDSPNSTPIIIGFDVTGSMGYLASEIATNALNETIMQILAKKPVTDPHMMCAAITQPSSPLQVTQFEADIRIVEQLLDFKLGGGNSFGYDNLLWYFAAKHTNIDSFNKRGKKGILIGIGDEVVGGSQNVLRINDIKNTFNDTIVKDISFEQAMNMASEKYELIHIVVGGDKRFEKGFRDEAYSGWKAEMPGRVAKLHEKNIDCLAEVIVSILLLLNGEDRAKILADLDANCRDIVRVAIEDVSFNPNDNSKTIGNDDSNTAKEKEPKQGYIAGLFNGIFSNRK